MFYNVLRYVKLGSMFLLSFLKGGAKRKREFNVEKEVEIHLEISRRFGIIK